MFRKTIEAAARAAAVSAATSEAIFVTKIWFYKKGLLSVQKNVDLPGRAVVALKNGRGLLRNVILEMTEINKLKP